MNPAMSSPRPWLVSTPLAVPDLGPGVDPACLATGLGKLCLRPAVNALVLFGSRARGQARPRSDLDLLIVDRAAAEQQKDSRWHVVGYAFREGGRALCRLRKTPGTSSRWFNAMNPRCGSP